jgi:glycosyl transferase family 25
VISVRAYVVNLVRSTDRRDHIRRQLDRVGLDYELVPAVDGRTLSADDRARLVHSSLEGAPQWLSAPGAIGCALSHLEVYRRIVASGDDAAVVLEDDVVLPGGIEQTIDEAEKHLGEAELVLLHFRSFEPCLFSRPTAIELSSAFRLAFPLDRRQPIASAAYVITQKACENMVASILPVQATADSWGHYIEIGAIERFRCIVPAPVGVAPRFKSTLDYVPLGSDRLRRFTEMVSRRHIFPFAQALSAARGYRMRKWGRTQWVDELPVYLT